MIDQCSKLQIVKDEDDVVDLGEDFDEDIDNKLALQLVGRIVTEKPLNFEAVKRTLLHVWNLKNGVVIRSMGVNLFLLQFFRWKDSDKILDGKALKF